MIVITETAIRAHLATRLRQLIGIKLIGINLAGIRLVAALLGFLLVSMMAQPVRAEGRFVADIPLMPDMQLEQDLGFSFDSPAGRIIVLYARSPQTNSAVLDFYASSLLALGWQGAGGLFQRGPEQLEIKAANSSAGRIWKIALTPRQP